MDSDGRVRTERGAKRVRVMLGGEVVADTTSPLMVWEKPYYPVYYFPVDDVRTEFLADTGETDHSPSRGDASRYVVKAGGAEGSAYAYHDPRIEDLAGHFAFEWASMDHWFEEDEEVFTHARDPFTRIDTLASSRRVRVEIDGTTVADSTHCIFLFETGLPVRHYFPKVDVHMDLLTPTTTATRCPYKGEARYWSVEIDGTVHEDIAWGYDAPLPESQRILGMVSFYDEKVDVYVDEELQERPKTPFA